MSPTTRFTVGLAALILSPIVLTVPALVEGSIPWAMDVVMYFYPLRRHAAELIARGEWPGWDRSLLCGTPLFANPQAALAYPFHWPFLVAPGPRTFFFPMPLQLGLWAGLTALAVRRLARSDRAGLFAGALCLAGNYGWSRFQFGNYLNVLPWWPAWVLGAETWLRGRRRVGLAIGWSSGALMLLAGAPQLAALGGLGLALYAFVRALAAPDDRRSWLAYVVVSSAGGALVGAPGWLPQWAHLRETTRLTALSAERALAGALGSPLDIVGHLVGPPAGGGVADAEASVAIGWVGLALAGVIPARGARFNAWIAAWTAAVIGAAMAWRPVAAALVEWRGAPIGLLHDPRRSLALAHWGLILAAGLGLATALEPPASRPLARVVPSLALLVLGGWARHQIDAGWMAATAVPATGAVLLVGSQMGRRAGPVLLGGMAIAGLAAAAWTTATTTDLQRLPVVPWEDQAVNSPLARHFAGRPGERILTVDWERATSYNYRRSDAPTWSLPNLPALWDGEDAGGYEPARLRGYQLWLEEAAAWPGGRQPWAEYFGLIYPPHPADGRRRPRFEEANVVAAAVPIWGWPVYFTSLGEGRWAGQPPDWPATGELRIVFLEEPAESSSPRVRVYLDSAEPREFALDARTRLEGLGGIIPAGAIDGASPPGTPIVHRLALGAERPQTRPALLPRLAAVEIEMGPSAAPPIGGFLWSEAIGDLWRPVQASGWAMICRYEGSPRWLEFAADEREPDATGQALPRRIAANVIQLETQWNGRFGAWLEIHEAYARGWHATVNGRPAPLTASPPEGKGPWRRVPIPPGPSTVRLTYRPPLLLPSLAAAALGLTLGGLAGRGRLRPAEAAPR